MDIRVYPGDLGGYEAEMRWIESNIMNPVADNLEINGAELLELRLWGPNREHIFDPLNYEPEYNISIGLKYRITGDNPRNTLSVGGGSIRAEYSNRSRRTTVRLRSHPCAGWSQPLTPEECSNLLMQSFKDSIAREIESNRESRARKRRYMTPSGDVDFGRLFRDTDMK